MTARFQSIAWILESVKCAVGQKAAVITRFGTERCNPGTRAVGHGITRMINVGNRVERELLVIVALPVHRL
jgi:hypothetical protein